MQEFYCDVAEYGLWAQTLRDTVKLFFDLLDLEMCSFTSPSSLIGQPKPSARVVSNMKNVGELLSSIPFLVHVTRTPDFKRKTLVHG